MTVLLFPVPGNTDTNMVVRALQAMEQGQWEAGRKLAAASKDPLAAKLYYWMYFRSKQQRFEYASLAQFIRKNPEWPGMSDLREKAERNMGGDLSPAEIVAWFKDYPPATANGLDRYAGALLATGHKNEAKAIICDWWASRLATRDEQKHIYYKYGRLIDMKAHRRRLDTLLFSKQYTNARAIAGVLGPGYQALTEARIALAEKKGGVNALIGKIPRNLQGDPGLQFERLRWRRMNKMDAEAMEILHNHPPVEEIQNPGDWGKEQQIIIRRLIEKRMYESAWLLAKDHFQHAGMPLAEAEWTSGWLALRFMNKPAEAYKDFENLYNMTETAISRSRGAYWAGRAAEAMGKKELAAEWDQKAAKFQTAFYGQLAGARLGMAQALPHAAPPELTAEDTKSFNNSELIRAARFFNAAGMSKRSSDFLEAFAEHNKTPKAYRFAAETAASLGRHFDAIKIAKEATNKGMFLTKPSYPVITNSLRNVDVEWALVHAVIRQESMFDADAVSSAGALGLMQLMPATARHTAKKHGLPANTRALTSNTDYNIRLGSAYMGELLDRYDGSYALAIAAYNAGPGRVSEWLETYGDPRTGKISLIDWIELIPIYETRNYVQRVLESVYVYRLRLKGQQKESLHPIHIAMTTQ